MISRMFDFMHFGSRPPIGAKVKIAFIMTTLLMIMDLRMVNTDYVCGYDDEKGLFCGNGIGLTSEAVGSYTYGRFDDPGGIGELLTYIAKEQDLILACGSAMECLIWNNYLLKEYPKRYISDLKPTNVFERFTGVMTIVTIYGKDYGYTIHNKHNKGRPVSNWRVRLMTTTMAVRVNAQNVVWIPLKGVKYTFGLVSSTLVVGPDPDPKILDGFCSPLKESSGRRGLKYYFSSEALTLKAKNGVFDYAQVYQIIRCIMQDQADRYKPIDRQFIVPSEIGGPQNVFNTHPNYTTSLDLPWFEPPYEISFGVVRGTKVFQDDKCVPGNESHFANATVEWCCQKCDNSSVMRFKDHSGGFLYPKEIVPIGEVKHHYYIKTRDHYGHHAPNVKVKWTSERKEDIIEPINNVYEDDDDGVVSEDDDIIIREEIPEIVEDPVKLAEAAEKIIISRKDKPKKKSQRLSELRKHKVDKEVSDFKSSPFFNLDLEELQELKKDVSSEKLSKLEFMRTIEISAVLVTALKDHVKYLATGNLDLRDIGGEYERYLNGDTTFEEMTTAVFNIMLDYSQTDEGSYALEILDMYDSDGNMDYGRLVEVFKGINEKYMVDGVQIKDYTPMLKMIAQAVGVKNLDFCEGPLDLLMATLLVLFVLVGFKTTGGGFSPVLYFLLLLILGGSIGSIQQDIITTLELVKIQTLRYWNMLIAGFPDYLTTLLLGEDSTLKILIFVMLTDDNFVFLLRSGIISVIYRYLQGLFRIGCMIIYVPGLGGIGIIKIISLLLNRIIYSLKRGIHRFNNAKTRSNTQMVSYIILIGIVTSACCLFDASRPIGTFIALSITACCAYYMIYGKVTIMELRYIGNVGAYFDLASVNEYTSFSYDGRLVGATREDGIRILNMPQAEDDVDLVSALLMALAFGVSFLSIPAAISIIFIIFLKTKYGSSRAYIVPTLDLFPNEVIDDVFEGVLVDGIYVLEIGFLGIKFQQGVAYCYNGVLHTLYHVTNGCSLRFGNKLIPVSWMNVTKDLVSYCGRWKFCKDPDSYVYVMLKEPMDDDIKPYKTKTHSMMIDGIETKYIHLPGPHGSSGSPIFNDIGNPVGLFGTGFTIGDEYCSIIHVIEEEVRSTGDAIISVTKSKKIVTAHPGFGKTRRLILTEIVGDSNKNKKIIVLVPTRVVMNELVDVLQKAEIRVNIQASEIKKRSVSVLCHATFAYHVIRNPKLMNEKFKILMDESHFKDPYSIFVRGLMENYASNGCEVIFYTATPPNFKGVCDSNFEILDHSLPEGENMSDSIDKVIKSFPDEKILCFLPTRSLCEKMAKKYDGIAIHRDNFETTYSLAKTGNSHVFTTNISEMGANYKINIVVDFMLNNAPILVDNKVKLKLITCDRASVNQRRGRVGRRAVGRYLSPHRLDSDQIPQHNSDEVCWIEGQMLIDNMKIYPMAEESDFFEWTGRFAFTDDAKSELFFKYLTDAGREPPPIWFTWNCVNNGIDPYSMDWISKRIIPGHEMTLKGEKVYPLFYDERLNNCDKFLDQVFVKSTATSAKDMHKYRQSNRSSVSLVPYIMAMVNTTILFEIFDKVKEHVDKVTYLKNDGLPDDMKQEAHESLTWLLIATGVFMLLLIFTCYVGNILLSIAKYVFGGRSNEVRTVEKTVTDSCFRPIMVMVSIVALYAVWTGSIKPEAILLLTLAGATLISVLNIIALGSHRSAYDVSLVKLIIITIIALSILYLFENGYLSRTESLFSGPPSSTEGMEDRIRAKILQEFEHSKKKDYGVDAGWDWVIAGYDLEPYIFDFGITPNASICAISMFLLVISFAQVCVDRSVRRVVWKLLGKAEVSERWKNIDPGFVVTSVRLSMFFISLPTSLATLHIVGFVGGFIGAIYVIIVVYNEEPATTDKVKKVNTEIDMKAPLEGYDLAPGHIPITNEWVIGIFLVILCIAIGFDSTYVRYFYVVALISNIVELIFSFRYKHLNLLTYLIAPVIFNGYYKLGFWILVVYLFRYFKREAKRSLFHGKMDFPQGYLWKEKLNAMSKKAFDAYKFHKVVIRDKGDYVSKGGNKLRDILRQSGLKPKGKVVDLGCGRGAWSQHLASLPDVTSVIAFTVGGESREQPQQIDTYGHNLITFKLADAHRIEPVEVDFIAIDIGESDPNISKETFRTIANIELLKKWLSVSPTADFVVKILCPYSKPVMFELEAAISKFGGNLWRWSEARNSNAELYYVSGKSRRFPGDIIPSLMKVLLKRMNETWTPPIELPGYTLKKGTRSVKNLAREISPVRYQTRLNKVMSEFSSSWRYDSNNPYRSFKYLGSFATSIKNSGGQTVNYLIDELAWPWNKRIGTVCMTMTDTTHAATQQVLREKVDTINPPLPQQLRFIQSVVGRWIWRLLFRKLKPRVLTFDDWLRDLRPDASVGSWASDMVWNSVEEAIKNPDFIRMIDEERELHLKGDCKNCIYNTMPKREKKPRQFGRPKGSRIIWYQWLGGRFLEYEALGFLNVDHWVARNNFPCGVGGLGVNYLGYEIKKIADRCEYLTADDIAGWDTRVTVEDLEDELMMTEFMDDEYHKELIRSVYKHMYMTVVAFFPRNTPSDKNNASGAVMDLVVRGDQRGSGQVVTYALNTITNAKVQLCRIIEAEIGLEAATDEDVLMNWLNGHAESHMNNMCVAGDDFVYGGSNERYPSCLEFLNGVGKVRKDIGLNEPSVVIKDWEKVSFCSNHFHSLNLLDGREIIVPCRDQDELIGRARVQKGSLASYKETGPIAKAYAQFWLCYYPYKRDIRLAGLAICSAVPSNWVPTGRTSWSIHQRHEWMTTEDMLNVWNRVWILDNPYMENKEIIDSWAKIPYLPLSKDIECGSLVGQVDRSQWAKSLPKKVSEVRKKFGDEHFTDYLSSLGRYKIKVIDNDILDL